MLCCAPVRRQKEQGKVWAKGEAGRINSLGLASLNNSLRLRGQKLALWPLHSLET